MLSRSTAQHGRPWGILTRPGRCWQCWRPGTDGTINVPIWTINVPIWTINVPIWTINVPIWTVNVPIWTINVPYG
jgi:hypothetical protein